MKTNDDWYSLARSNGLSAQDLIYFNFRTHDPAEINDYLRTLVGCTKAIRDQKNWMFTSGGDAGRDLYSAQGRRAAARTAAGDPAGDAGR